MSPPRRRRIHLPDGSELPQKTWRTREKERNLGLRLDPPPPDDDSNLAPPDQIPPAAQFLRPRYVWQIDRWPFWRRLRYRGGIAINWAEVVTAITAKHGKARKVEAGQRAREARRLARERREAVEAP